MLLHNRKPTDTDHFCSVVVSFMYRPRTRPARPIPPPESHFLADVKAMPEEWHQLTIAVSPRPKVQLPPVDLHVRFFLIHSHYRLY